MTDDQQALGPLYVRNTKVSYWPNKDILAKIHRLATPTAPMAEAAAAACGVLLLTCPLQEVLPYTP